MAPEDTKRTPGQNPEAGLPQLSSPADAPGDVAPSVNPSPRFYRDWRGSVTTAAMLNVAAGAWLIASPFMLPYVDGDSRLNAIVVGAAVAILALVRTGARRIEWLSAVNFVLGAWLFVSGFWLATSPAASWNSWLLGLAVILLALLGLDATEEGRMERSNGGRRELSPR